MGLFGKMKTPSELSAEVKAGSDKSLSKLKAIAEAGDPQALVELGVLHANGNRNPYVAQNFTEANKCYLQAAIKGKDRDAYYNMGISYFFGLGIEQNLEKASLSFQAAKEQGSPIAEGKIRAVQIYKNVSRNTSALKSDIKSDRFRKAVGSVLDGFGMPLDLADSIQNCIDLIQMTAIASGRDSHELLGFVSTNRLEELADLIPDPSQVIHMVDAGVFTV